MLEGARQLPGSLSKDSRLTLVSPSPGAWAQKADSLGLSPDSTSLTAYAVLLTLHRQFNLMPFLTCKMEALTFLHILPI